MEEVLTRVTIDVGIMHYRDLNYNIRQKIVEGFNHIVLENVMGQRYIGAGLDSGLIIEIKGVPGQDLGVFNAGAKIIVYGNAQDGVGNTMNDGYIIIHGSVGDIPGHMVRNGKIYIRGSAGFRAGIMMKEYGSKRPVMIVGETLGDYAGEYMAGGTLMVLGYSLKDGVSPVSRYMASGIFGGEIYVRGEFKPNQLGKGALIAKTTSQEIERIYPFLKEYAGIFGMDLERILDSPFYTIRRQGGRPYGNLYVPSGKIERDLIPLHRNVNPPCTSACPVGIPNPIIIRKLREGRIQDAFDIIDDNTPFRYSCCGMVCPGLCRQACTRNILDEPVKIDEIARNYHSEGEVKVLEDPKEERIGIIGAGPSGLASAWHLARRGYRVDIYEKEKDIGGKLTYNIPEDRLSRSDVERDLRRIRSLNINFNTGIRVDDKLFKDMVKKYDAIIIACGTQKPKTLGFKGAVSSFHFLRSVKSEENNQDLKGKACVIAGAGNVAMDVACECFRLGAESVTAVDIVKPSAFGKEIDKAIALGTRVLFPKFIEKYEDRKVFFRDGENLRADILIEAIGELPELEFAGESLTFNRESFETNIPKVYIIGDALNPGLVTHSLGMGKELALYLHGIFRGIPLVKELREVVDKKKINLLYFKKGDVFASSLDACFSCGNCLQCDICVENCPRGAVKRIGENFIIDSEICSGCGVCASVCPRGAIVMMKKNHKGGASE